MPKFQFRQNPAPPFLNTRTPKALRLKVEPAPTSLVNRALTVASTAQSRIDSADIVSAGVAGDVRAAGDVDAGIVTAGSDTVILAGLMAELQCATAVPRGAPGAHSGRGGGEGGKGEGGKVHIRDR